MSRRASPSLMAACAIALLAGDLRPAAAQAVRRAAVQVIENREPLWTPAATLRLSHRPVLRIGDESSEPYQFSRIGGAVRLTNGAFVVADGGSSQLRFFDSAGRFTHAAGRPGQGPGEFTQLDLLIRLPGDTLVAGSAAGALSHFTSEGSFIRQTNLRTIGAPLPPGFRVLLGVFHDQSLLVALVPRVSPRPGVSRWVDSMPVHVVDRTATRARLLGRFPYTIVAMVGGNPSPPWFSPPPAFAVSGRSLYFGFGTEYAVEVHSIDGELRRVIRRSWAPRRVTDRDIDAYVTEWSRRWIRETGAEGERRRRELRDSPYADVVPAFSQFIVDRTGRLWVREAHLADAPGNGSLNGPALVPSGWSVFDAEGRWLGDVAMPAHFTPRDIGSDYVLGVARDADGVESIALFRLEHPP